MPTSPNQDQSIKTKSLNFYFRAIAQYILTHSKATLFVVCVCTLSAIWIIIDRIKVDNNLEVFAPANSKVLKSRDQYQKMFVLFPQYFQKLTSHN